jgi:hypothetical protein
MPKPMHSLSFGEYFALGPRGTHDKGTQQVRLTMLLLKSSVGFYHNLARLAAVRTTRGFAKKPVNTGSMLVIPNMRAYDS